MSRKGMDRKYFLVLAGLLAAVVFLQLLNTYFYFRPLSAKKDPEKQVILSGRPLRMEPFSGQVTEETVPIIRKLSETLSGASAAGIQVGRLFIESATNMHHMVVTAEIEVLGDSEPESISGQLTLFGADENIVYQERGEYSFQHTGGENPPSSARFQIIIDNPPSFEKARFDLTQINLSAPHYTETRQESP